MIPFIDLGVGAYLKSLFLAYPVVMAPTDTVKSRQALARMQKNNEVGVPGLCYWRTATPRDGSSYNIAQATEGYNSGQNQALTYDKIAFVRVMCEYELVGWTTRYSDRCSMERTLRFSEPFQTIPFNFEGQTFDHKTFDITTDVAFAMEDPTYEEEVDPKTGKPLYYALRTRLAVSGQWVKTHQDPYIDEILVKFYDVLNSEAPITESLINTVTITPRT